MADITQRHLNTQLERYCQLNGGMYNHVHVCAPDEPIPANFDIDTIILQKQGRTLVAYWHENGHVVEKALRSKNTTSIEKMLPSSGVSQSRKLINKIIDKYECNIAPNASFIESNGNCNGWSFLYPYYVSTGREREFKALRKYISKWKGQYEFEQLPAELRGQYQNGNEVFQQLINDLVWFQHSPNKLQLLYGGPAKRKLSQDDRKKQYSMLKLPGIVISDICYYGDRGVGDPATIRDENVIRVMEFYAQWPDSWIDFTIHIGGDHTVSAYITKDGKFKYYDSNNKDADVKELSARECLAAMKAEYVPYNLEVKVKRINLHKFHGPMVADVLNDNFKFKEYDPETAKLLLKNAFKSNQIEFAEFLLRDYITIERSAEFINKNRILTDINAETDRHLIDLLVRYGADVNQPVSDGGWTPLHIACLSGNDSVVKTLRRHHVDVNVSDASGATPLHYAAKFGNSSMMKYLISHEGNLDVVDRNGFNLLHYAASGKNIKAMREILSAGKIDINAQDNQGNTAMHYAVKMGMTTETAQRLNQVEMIKLLRQYKASLSIVNHNHEKPIDSASNPAAKAALAERILIRRDGMENVNLLNLPRVAGDRVPVKKSRSSSSASTSYASSSGPSSPASVASSSGPSTGASASSSSSARSRPMLLGSIPPGVVAAQSQQFEQSTKKTEEKPKGEQSIAQSEIKTKVAFFEEKIREQAPQPSTSRPKKI
ncbi:ankyrin repeat domain-containing protein [Candidatus Berkiella aquae]|uniref:Ankyrin repeat domain-containing protein n=1 Tax=Candidatus Berkiella aquae TaxID=295108 RepID=A0A0Q9YPN1_9GAMM|nr:ankyrin repeat domain-containing protein [Candidatus Berkiella aquae]MCS5711890.1 ankyrin repeat domain-containing protein [Candidatus Berkiella aquae]